MSAVTSPADHRYGQDPTNYPINGITYILKSPKLLFKILCAACLGFVLSLIVLILLLVFALKPQAEVFGGLQWWSWVLAVLAVLLEAAILSSSLLVLGQSKIQREVFVFTMRAEGRWREDTMKKPSTLKDLNLVKRAFWVRIVTSPLNLIPVAGNFLYSALNATFIGWDYMDRYFDAIHMDDRSQRTEVFGEDRSDCSSVFHQSTYNSDNDFARFGFVCSLLESVPVAGSALFPLTNACAAALFACDIEAKGGPISMRLLEAP